LGPHELHDQRSLAIHRLIAERICADRSLLAKPRRRVAEWRQARTMNPKYPEAWSALLDGPIEKLVEVLLDPGEAATELRHVSPFAGIIDMETRERVWRETKDRLESHAQAAIGP
jgi:hypothetical protein